MKNRETIFLLRSVLNPAFLLAAVSYWSGLILKYLLRKSRHLTVMNKLYKLFFYPPYLKAIIEENNCEYQEAYLQGLMSDNVSYASPDFTSTEKAGLWGEKTVFRDLKVGDMPDWFQTYDDIEDLFSVHRWGWLLIIAVEQPSAEVKKWGIRVMEDWFLQMDNRRDHPAWESYSTSERIANAILFLYALRDFPYVSNSRISFLGKKLIEAAVYLKDYLEFNGEMTNNHILNNARALYMLGRFSSCRSFSDMGRKIIINETRTMITPSGFLRECSSNYNLLLLRSYLEIFWVAKQTGDMNFADRMSDTIQTMVKAAWFFHVYNDRDKQWDYPLIGDITPDFPAAWLRNICFSSPALHLYRPFRSAAAESSGWNRIWNDKDFPPASAISERCSRSGFNAYHEDGWYRLDYKDYIIIWHVSRDGSIPPYSHGHNDIMSFVLYYKGVPFLIDTGRFRYTHDALGLYGRTAAAHNSFTLDGFDPYPVARALHPPFYRKGRTTVDYHEIEDGYRLNISHDGFSRINNTLSARREFWIHEGCIQIKDVINGQGTHMLKTFFHFDRAYAIEAINDNIIDISSSSGTKVCCMEIKGTKNHRASFHCGILDPVPAGWVFPAYGTSEPATTCIIEASIDLPCCMEYNFSF